MAVQVHMPQWGMAMTEGKITQWLKHEGEAVQKGDPLFEVETEKITNTAEAIASGVLYRIIVGEGETVAVGTVVAIIAAEGETPDIEQIPAAHDDLLPQDTEVQNDAARTGAPKAGAFVPATPAARRLAKELGVELGLVSGTGQNGRVTERDVHAHLHQQSEMPSSTSVAKRLAAQAGVDISTIQGTGPRGKITKVDIEKSLSRQAAAPQDALGGTRSVPYEGMRKSIGDSMLSSLTKAAQLSAFTEVDVTGMVDFRDVMREENKNDESIKISFNDIVIMAVSRSLVLHPMMNSHHIDDEIVVHDFVNLGIAVATPKGLMVPVLKNAHQKGLLQIAREARELATKAREGSLSLDEVSDGTFTISNTSMIEVDGFTPILRPPETGILGIGRVKRKPAEYRGEIALRWMAVLSLTYNHCVVDGAPAHQFLATVGRYLQNPLLMMS